MDNIAAALDAVTRRIPQLVLRRGEPMKNHTSFKIGGPLRAMAFPSTEEQLAVLSALLHEFDAAPLIVGNGTNLLADDQPLDLIAVKTTGVNSIKRSGGVHITAGCGASLSKLASRACELGLSGLEFAHGIPGSLGGAVSMNAGAYGGEMKDVVTETSAVRSGGNNDVFTITGAEHGFGYRKSRFSGGGEVILSSVVRLVPGDKAEIKANMDALQKKRRESQPLTVPSAGSTFKRPKDAYAAALIEQAGLKGFASGGAQVSEKHAGFVVNRGGASFDDVIAVIEYVQETVLRRFGIELEPEIKIIRSAKG